MSFYVVALCVSLNMCIHMCLLKPFCKQAIDKNFLIELHKS